MTGEDDGEESLISSQTTCVGGNGEGREGGGGLNMLVEKTGKELTSTRGSLHFPTKSGLGLRANT